MESRDCRLLGAAAARIPQLAGLTVEFACGVARGLRFDDLRHCGGLFAN
jgi:hypothetical protein